MPKEVTFEDLPILQSSYVFIKDKNVCLEKINKIIRDGYKRLQIVTDFDLTLTKQHVDGKLILSSFEIFSRCKQLPHWFKDETDNMYKKYRPIEIDPQLPLETKINAMMEWMIETDRIMRNFDFDPKEIDEVAKQYGTSLRDRTKELFVKMKDHDVPILVFSAGLGDVVQEILRSQGVLFPNVNIISNFLKFNNKQIDGFKGDRLIHVFNKNEHAIEHEYFEILEGRTNVILMGDTTGDSTMADGVKDTETILKIGFLYEHVEESLPQFMDSFDIVLVDDQTMNIILEILRNIL